MVSSYNDIEPSIKPTDNGRTTSAYRSATAEMLSKSSFSSSKINFRSLRTISKSKTFSYFLAVSLAAISGTLVALTSTSIAWWNNYYGNGNGPVILTFRNYSAYPESPYDDANNATWQNYLDYKDPNVSASDTYALLFAGITGTICASLVLALPFWLQESWTFGPTLRWPGRNRKKINLTRHSLTTLLDAVLSLLFLAIGVVVWIDYGRSWYNYSGIYTLPPHPLNHTLQGIASVGTTLETWNCDISYSVAPRARKPSNQEFARQCSNAYVSRQLMIALLALALSRLSRLVFRPLMRPWKEFREWKRNTQAMREGKTSEFDDRGNKRRRSRDEEEGDAKLETGRDSVHEVDAEAVHQDFIAELPGCRMSRVEMDEDAARAEMPGAEGGKEMDAGPAAVEKDAVVKT